MKRFSTTPSVWFDAGNLFDGIDESRPAKNTLLLDVMKSMGYRAANVADADLRDGVRAFVELTAMAGFPFVSSSFRYAGSGTAVFRENLIVNAGGWRIGVIGVNRAVPGFKGVGPEGPIGVIEPAAAVERGLEGLRGKTDVIVLLAYADHATGDALAAKFPEVDLVLATFGQELVASSMPGGFARVQFSGDEGRFVVENRLRFDAVRKIAGQRTFLHYLSARYPSDPEVGRAVDAVEAPGAGPSDAAPAGLSGAASPAPVPQAALPSLAAGLSIRFITAKGCAECHEEEYGVWSRSRHAQAFRALPETKRGAKECVSCHVTGVEMAGGWTGPVASSELNDVQCEACHRAGERHEVDPKGSPMGRVAPWVCRSCHDAANSPEFNHDVYWKKIEH